MHRFFVQPEQISGNQIKIIGEDVIHMKKVLRFSTKDSIICSDGLGNEYHCQIVELSEKVVLCEITEVLPHAGEPSIQVTLFQGIPKAGKMETILQKTTELGVRSLVPVITKRTVVKLEGQKQEQKKQERWQRVAYEAAKQAGRGVIPTVQIPVSFTDAVKQCKDFDLILFPYELEKTASLSEIIKAHPNVEKIAVFIGPEGGFDPQEVETVQQICAGRAYVVTLGSRILRTETAGMAVLSVLMYAYDQWR